jgi:hypothetical protein
LVDDFVPFLLSFIREAFGKLLRHIKNLSDIWFDAFRNDKFSFNGFVRKKSVFVAF